MNTRIIFPFLFIIVYCYTACSQKINMPVYPTYEAVVKQFFTQYTAERIQGENLFSIAKKPDGWHVVLRNYYNNQIAKDELFWSRKKNEYLELSFPHYVQASIDHNQNSLLNDSWAITASALVPYWGYDGWEMDVIKEFAGKNLSDTMLNAVGRAYSSYARTLLNRSDFGDPNVYEKIPKGQNALSPELLAKYLENRHLATETYYKLYKQNPKFETFVANIYNVYSNDVMDGFLTLRYFQNEEIAKNELKKDLYDPFYIEMAKNYLNSCDQDAILFTNGDMDTYPLLYVQENENFRKDILIVNLSLLNLGRYIYHLANFKGGANPLKLGMDPEIYKSETKQVIYLHKTTDKPISMDEAIRFVVSADASDKLKLSDNQLVDYLPSKNINIKIDNEKIKSQYENKIDTSLNISLKYNYLTVSQFCILDIIATNHFERPVYFAKTVDSENYLGFEPYFSLEGLAYKIIPVRTESEDRYNPGSIQTAVLFDKLFNKLNFELKNYTSNQLSKNSRNMITVYRDIFARLARQLASENNNEKVNQVIERCLQLFPEDVINYDYTILDFIRSYFEIKQKEKAKALLSNYMKSTIKEVERLKQFKGLKDSSYDLKMKVYLINEMLRIAQEFLPDDQITKDLQVKFEQYGELIN